MKKSSRTEICTFFEKDPWYWIKNKKKNVYPCLPQFYYIKKWDIRGIHFTDMLGTM